MDDLEKYISENRQAFEEEEPDSAVWKRLERRLQDEKPKRQMWLLSGPVKKWVAVAAVFLLCVSFVAFVRTYQVKKEQGLQAIPADLLDAKAYYQGQISTKIAEINKLEPKYRVGDSTIWNLFEEEDGEYHRLRKALAENPDNPHVRAAFVEYYRSRLEVLKRIQKRMEIKNSDNP